MSSGVQAWARLEMLELEPTSRHVADRMLSVEHWRSPNMPSDTRSRSLDVGSEDGRLGAHHDQRADSPAISGLVSEPRELETRRT